MARIINLGRDDSRKQDTKPQPSQPGIGSQNNAYVDLIRKYQDPLDRLFIKTPRSLTRIKELVFEYGMKYNH